MPPNSSPSRPSAQRTASRQGSRPISCGLKAALQTAREGAGGEGGSMRFLILFLLACASGLACTVGVSANGSSVSGYSASCSDSFSNNLAELSISGVWVEVGVFRWTPGEGAPVATGPASASLYENYVLTVTGGSGEGVFQPAFSYSGWYDRGTDMSGNASIADNSGNVCGIYLRAPPQYTQCGTFMPFVFGTPETLDVSLYLPGVPRPPGSSRRAGGHSPVFRFGYLGAASGEKLCPKK
jgi:hypothetical protein